MNEKSKSPTPTLIKGDKGVALLITLLVLTLLMTIILEFNQGMRVEARAAANFRDDMKAYYLAKSGITFAIALLEEDKKTDPKDVDSLNELWSQKIPPIPVGDGFVSIEITDEDSKINVNKLSTGLNNFVTKNHMRTLMVRFLELFELNSELADTITDWTDQNDEEQPGNGAESGYYQGLENPYEAKNRPVDSLQELRLIKGMDEDIYSKLKNYLTVKSDGWINVNTASKEVLMSLAEEMTGDTADAIIAERVKDPLLTVNDLSRYFDKRAPVYGEISKFVNVNSNYFSVTSTGDVNQNKKTINAIVKRDGEKTKIVYWRVE